MEKKGYKFDRYIFRAYAALIVLYVLFTFQSFGWDFEKKVYVRCDADFICENPLWLACDNAPPCFMETLPPHYVYGTPPTQFNKFMNYGWLIALFGAVVAILSNHIIHNRGKNFPLEVEGLGK